MKIFCLILLLMLSVSSFAKAKKDNSRRYVPKKINTQLKKNMKFNDQLVNGKYMFSQDAMATVEDEKSLGALLGLRTEFKDRLEDLSKRY